MTFTEIFEAFKNHCYIRRNCWDKKLYIQYRVTVNSIRLVQLESECFPVVINNDIRMIVTDLLADDWDIMDESKLEKMETIREA